MAASSFAKGKEGVAVRRGVDDTARDDYVTTRTINIYTFTCGTYAGTALLVMLLLLIQ